MSHQSAWKRYMHSPVLLYANCVRNGRSMMNTQHADHLQASEMHYTRCDGVSYGVSYALCWHADSSVVLLINKNCCFLQNISKYRAVTPYFYFTNRYSNFYEKISKI